MVNCPACGTDMPEGTVVCTNCGSEIDQGGQHATGTPELGVDAGVPGSEIPESRGGGVDRSQGDREEPPEGWTSSYGVDMPREEVPDRGGIMTEGPTGAPARPTPWWPFLVLAIIVVIAAIWGILYFGEGDGDGNGNGNGENGPPPLPPGLYLDKEGTNGSYLFGMSIEYHLTVVVLNNATEGRSLEGHDVEVIVRVNGQQRAEDVRALNGTLEPGATTRYEVDLDTGVMVLEGSISVTVRLRKDDGATQVDMTTLYHTIE